MQGTGTRNVPEKMNGVALSGSFHLFRSVPMEHASQPLVNGGAFGRLGLTTTNGQGRGDS